ncbi:unnamed protein product [Trichogramma brassicae]|uniref:Ubiquitin-like protease family profile domain-containing protein n=1 Tax=Trichogramma brassicae TaxID=86971 RepID=A0A6H5J097_9HYME|nr:unnamed protein product [Trichogramma brassicae]
MVGDDNLQIKRSRIALASSVVKELKNRVIIPYLYKCHWRLLVIEIAEKTYAFFDPYNCDDDVERALDALNYFLTKCKKDSPLQVLYSTKRTRKVYENVPSQMVADGSSCGLYVLHYIKTIGNCKNFDEKFDPHSYRAAVARELLIKSEDMMNNCMHCMKLRKEEETMNQCKTCKRIWHDRCSPYSNADTDEEKAQERGTHSLLHALKTLHCVVVRGCCASRTFRIYFERTIVKKLYIRRKCFELVRRKLSAAVATETAAAWQNPRANCAKYVPSVRWRDHGKVAKIRHCRRMNNGRNTALKCAACGCTECRVKIGDIRADENSKKSHKNDHPTSAGSSPVSKRPRVDAPTPSSGAGGGEEKIVEPPVVSPNVLPDESMRVNSPALSLPPGAAGGEEKSVESPGASQNVSPVEPMRSNSPASSSPPAPLTSKRSWIERSHQVVDREETRRVQIWVTLRCPRCSVSILSLWRSERKSLPKRPAAGASPSLLPLHTRASRMARSVHFADDIE